MSDTNSPDLVRWLSRFRAGWSAGLQSVGQDRLDVARQVEQSYGAGWSAGYEAKGRERPPDPPEDDDIEYDTPVLSHRDEYGWLIEATTPDGAPTWWTGEFARGISWSCEAFNGIRYARRADAEKQIADWEPKMWPWAVRATEHGFARSTQPDSPCQDSSDGHSPVLSSKDSIEYDTPVLPRIPTGGTTASDSMRVEKRQDDLEATRERDKVVRATFHGDAMTDAENDRAALLDLLDNAVRERDELLFAEKNLLHRLENAIAAQDERDALRATISSEIADTMILRRRYGAKDDETYPAFVARVVAERDEGWRREAKLIIKLSDTRDERDKAVAGWGLTAALKGELKAARAERDAHDRASEAMRLNLQTRISERDIKIGELEAERDALAARVERLRGLLARWVNPWIGAIVQTPLLAESRAALKDGEG